MKLNLSMVNSTPLLFVEIYKSIQTKATPLATYTISVSNSQLHEVDSYLPSQRLIPPIQYNFNLRCLNFEHTGFLA